jgi:hypothetical protein
VIAGRTDPAFVRIEAPQQPQQLDDMPAIDSDTVMIDLIPWSSEKVLEYYLACGRP